MARDLADGDFVRARGLRCGPCDKPDHVAGLDGRCYRAAAGGRHPETAESLFTACNFDDGARPVSPSREYRAPLAWRGAEVPAQAQRQRRVLTGARILIGRLPVKHLDPEPEKIVMLPCVAQR